MSATFRVLNAVMIPIFAISVYVQYNDPDPLAWMAIYGAALISCVLVVRDRRYWQFSVLIGAIALGWAASLLPHVLGRVALEQMFESWTMNNNPLVEEARESGGLLIVASWMLLQSLAIRFAAPAIPQASIQAAQSR